MHFHRESSFQRRQVDSAMIKDKVNVFKETSDFLGPNHRNNFRVTLNEINCSVKFLDFENKTLSALTHKMFNGYLENISMSGLKLICDFDFPVKQSILIEINFELKNHEFILRGEIVRKEENNNKDLVAYGIQFLDIHEEESKLLNLILNQIILESRE